MSFYQDNLKLRIDAYNQEIYNIKQEIITAKALTDLSVWQKRTNSVRIRGLESQLRIRIYELEILKSQVL